MNEKRKLSSAAGVVSFATLISRILGVVREQVLAAYFGAGFFTDAFLVAFRIPNLLRDLFAEGAMSASFVPTFTKYLKEAGNSEAMRLTSIVINLLLIVLSGLTLLIIIFSRPIVLVLAMGFSRIGPEKIDLTVKMTQIMSPFLLFVALAAVFMGMLNSFGKFFIPALAPAIFNIACILAGIFLSPLMPSIGQEPIVSMAIGALLGAVGQLFIQIPTARKLGFRYSPTFDFSHPGLKRILMLMAPATFGLAATQISIIVDNIIASYFGDGPISWLNYSFRIMMLPIGLFGVAIATVNLAEVSKNAADGDTSALKRTVARSIRLAAVLTIPATAGIIALRTPIIRILYERGKFGPFDTEQTSYTLLFYAIGLFAYSLVKIIVPTFYALGDTKTPVKVSALTVALKIGLNFLFLYIFRLLGIPGYLGLPLSTSAAAMINFSFLGYNLSWRTGGFKGLGIGSVVMKMVMISAFMGLICNGFYRVLASFLDPRVFFLDLTNLIITIIAGIFITFLSCFLLNVDEVKEFFIRKKR